MQSKTLFEGSPEHLAKLVAKELIRAESEQARATQNKHLSRLSLITIDQVAEIAGVSKTTAWKWANDGCFGNNGSKQKERYILSEVLAFVAGREDRRLHFPK